MLDVRLFNTMEIYDDEGRRRQIDFHGYKPRVIFLVLATRLGTQVSKESLAGYLWQGAPPASWISTLEGYVSLLRKALTTLQCVNSPAGSVIVSRHGGYLLDASRVRTDLQEFDRLVAEAGSTAPDQALPLLTDALALVRGDVMLGERAMPWIVETREAYQQAVQRAAVQAGRHALAADNLEAAARYGKLACVLDPLSEAGWQISIESDWRADRRSDALRDFSALRNLLDRELGIAPCRSLQQLVTRVLRDEPYSLSA